MKKSKKVISFFCSLAMMVSAFSGIVVAKAEESEITKGIAIEYVASESTSEYAVLDVYAKGYSSLRSYTVGLTTETEGVEFDSIEILSSTAGFSLTPAVATATQANVVGTISTADEPAVTETEALVKVKLTFKDALSTSAEIKLASNSLLSSKATGTVDKITVSAGTMPEYSVEIPADPNATEAPTDTPTPEPTKAPIAKGIELVYDRSQSTAEYAVISAYAKGYTSLRSYTLGLTTETEGVEFDAIEILSSTNGFSLTPAVATATQANVVGTISTADEPAVTETEPLVTVKLTFKSALTTDTKIGLASNSLLSSKATGTVDKITVSAGTMPVDSVVALANPTATEAATEEATEAATETATTAPTEAPYETIRPARISTEAPASTEASTEAATEAATATSTEAPIEKGIELVYDKSQSAAEYAVISAYAKGYTSLRSYTLGLTTETEGVEFDTIEILSSTNGFSLTPAVATATQANVVGTISTADEPAVTETEPLVTVKLTFKSALTTDTKIGLASNSLLSSKATGTVDKITVSAGTMPVDSVVALASPTATEEATAEPTDAPTPAPFTGDETVKFSDLANTTGLENLIGFDVTVKGTYGKDYAAFLNGTQLTEDEFLDAVHGYTATPAELVAGLTIAANDGVTITVTPATQTAEQAAKDPETWTLYPGLAVTKTISVATPSPSPSPTPTPTPSGSGSGPSSGSSSTRPGGGSGNTIASASGSTVGGGVVSVTSVNFQDLGSVPWAQTAINALASMGIINGRTNTEFDPNASVTRAEFAKMVCAAFGVQPSTKTTQTFTDVLTSDWYFGYVEAAAERGIVLGISDTEFAPNALITREQMAAMMYRAINVTGAVLKQGTSKTFADAYAISDYAKAPVDALSAAGVINGIDDSTFAPKDNATRAQAACIIYQYFTSLAG